MHTLNKHFFLSLFFFQIVVEWGEDVKVISEEEALLFANHQATGDVCTLMMCLQDKGTVGCFYIYMVIYVLVGFLRIIVHWKAPNSNRSSPSLGRLLLHIFQAETC